jgi:hypothetical protein
MNQQACSKPNSEGSFYRDLRSEWTMRQSTPTKLKVSFQIFDSNIDTIAASTEVSVHDDMVASSSTDVTASVLIKPLIIIFDEAHTLSITSSPGGDNSPIRQICRIINSRINGLHAIGIVVSTKRYILNYPPINQICIINKFTDNIILRGRPLWKTIHTYYDGDFNKVVQYALRRLVNVNGMKEHQLDPIIALFAARFALYPAGELADRMVANHLATLVNVDETNDGRFLTVKYHSEPILAEASAWITSSLSTNYEVKYSLIECLETLHNKLVLLDSEGEFLNPNISDIGELIAAVALAFSADRTRISSMNEARLEYDANDVNCTLSRAISVPDFLKSICNTLSTDKSFNFGDLDEFEINFTHFVKENVDNRSILEMAYEQHAAFLMGSQTKGYNMVIVMKRKVNTNQEEVEYGLIVIQVKNYKDPVSDGERDDVINNCNHKLFVHLKVSKILTILLAVGGQRKQDTINAFTFPGDYAEMKKFPLRTSWSQFKTDTTAENCLCMAIGLSSFRSLSVDERSLLYNIAQSKAEISTYPRTKIDAILQFGPFAT